MNSAGFFKAGQQVHGSCAFTRFHKSVFHSGREYISHTAEKGVLTACKFPRGTAREDCAFPLAGRQMLGMWCGFLHPSVSTLSRSTNAAFGELCVFHSFKIGNLK